MKLTAAKGLMEKMAFDVEVCMKQWRVSEFLLKKKKLYSLTFIGTLNIYGNKTVDVRTVR